MGHGVVVGQGWVPVAGREIHVWEDKEIHTRLALTVQVFDDGLVRQGIIRTVLLPCDKQEERSLLKATPRLRARPQLPH